MYDERAEAMSIDERTALQQERLREMVGKLLAYGGVQGQRLRAAGVTGSADVRIDRLSELPTTTKQDLWATYPFGMLSTPRETVVAVHGSSGTGGRPTLVGYTQSDLDLWGDMVARSLGCVWAGSSSEPPPEELDAAIIFAPVGALVPEALSRVRKGGRVICAGIHMSDIPSFPYEILWGERSILSVANLARAAQ